MFGKQNLSQKIDLSRARMSELLEKHGPDRVFVAWTGGKDSTATLCLWRRLLAEKAADAPIRALSIDTGVKFPEIVAFRDRYAEEWNLDLTVVRPGVDLAEYPVAGDKVACCRKLKIEPLQRAIRDLGVAALLTGVRADEHQNRADRQWYEERAEPAHTLAHPLLHWTEMDIWAFAMDAGLPYCELYDQGYRSLGCVPCTAKSDALGPERAGRDRDKESRMGMLHSLGYF